MSTKKIRNNFYQECEFMCLKLSYNCLHVKQHKFISNNFYIFYKKNYDIYNYISNKWMTETIQ